MSKTPGKRNKSAGSGWERVLAQKFRDIGFPHVITTRQGSRLRDSQKIDLMNSDEDKHGRLEYNVQAKNTVGHLSYAKVISELPQEKGIINVILHKQTEKVNNRFVVRDTFAILYLEDFLKMVEKLKEYECSTPRRGVVSISERGDRQTLLSDVKDLS